MAAAQKYFVDQQYLDDAFTMQCGIMQAGLVVFFGIASKTADTRYRDAFTVGFFVLTLRWTLTG